MDKIVENIIESINLSRKKIDEHNEYSNRPGIYCFFLTKSSELKEFGKGDQVLYVGIAKESLKKRDLSQHFKTGQTGRSTLRRSIGAILKQELKLKAIPRGGFSDTKRIDNYKFDEPEDNNLTKWMESNLEIGYWEDKIGIEHKELRELEKLVITQLKPTLDLDQRTRKYNSLAERLTCLRNICKLEVCKEINKQQ